MPAATLTLATSAEPGAPLALLYRRADDVPAVLPTSVAPADVVTAATTELTRRDAKGEPGDVVALTLSGTEHPVVLLAGVGDGTPVALRKAGAALARAARDDERLALALPTEVTPEQLTALAVGVGLASYRIKTTGPRLQGAALVVPSVTAPAAAALRAAVTATDVTVVARDLANAPALELSPQTFAERAQARGEEHGFEVTVRDERWLAEHGFGGLVAVGQGSQRPPRLVELRYEPGKQGRPTVLVGKGITFDSGGLSIKPADGMMTMKTDMSGAGAVLAAMTGLKRAGVRRRVIGLLPLAENMPSGSAQRPGDVIRHYGGRTSEVLNTDAEGRLVLADALAYADATLDPQTVVDLATLTGAATLGLGRRHAALYATDPALVGELEAAAEASGERVWHMPLVEEYRQAIDSDIADLRNAADPGRHFSGGSITAALFLREFAGPRRWAHLDIAGPARAESDEDVVAKGATGFGARLLLAWLARER